jgi:hypothetical protein
LAAASQTFEAEKMLGGRGEADACRLGRARVGSENRWEYAR